MSVLDILQNIGCIVEPCGSRVTCDPAPADTDADYLVEIGGNRDKDTVARVVNEISRAGLTWEGNEHYQDAVGEFMSWRGAGDMNLIVTANPEFARKHRAATALCKRLNLINKQDRIALFQAVLYGNHWNGETWAEMKAKQMAFRVTPEAVPF